MWDLDKKIDRICIWLNLICSGISASFLHVSCFILFIELAESPVLLFNILLIYI